MGRSVNPSFWAGRNVLVTGHTGFKGSWLSAWLHRLGAAVTGVSDQIPTEPSLFVDARLDASLRDRRADVADASAIRAVLTEGQPEVVFHLAAQSLVRPSYDDPLGTFRTNIMGTAAVLDACRSVDSVRVVVVVTSDKCYDNVGSLAGYHEQDRLGGHDPYSSSKACAELVAHSYRASFLAAGGVALVTARGGNVLGGGDWSRDRLVPDAIRAAAAGAPLQVRSPEAIRPWQDVRDCLMGYLLLAERAADDPALAGAWNFGPDTSHAVSVASLLERIATHWPDVRWEADHRSSPHEADVLFLDSGKARTELGWTPRVPLDTCVDDLVTWYRARAKGMDAADLLDAQLDRYERLGTEAA